MAHAVAAGFNCFSQANNISAGILNPLYKVKKPQNQNTPALQKARYCLYVY